MVDYLRLAKELYGITDVLRWDNIVTELSKPAGNLYSIYWDPSKWDWSVLLDPFNFYPKVGVTPMADFRVISFDLDCFGCMGRVCYYHHRTSCSNGV